MVVWKEFASYTYIIYNLYTNITGTKFLLTADPLHPNCTLTLKKIYEIYADFVMKNPFHNLEMPIRSDLFEEAITTLMKTKWQVKKKRESAISK